VGFHLQPWNSLPGPTKAEGDQRFESISLHRRVGCEPDFPDHGCSIPAPIAPRVDRDRLAQPFSGRSPISAIEDAGEPQAFCRTEFVGSAALAIQFRQKLQRWGGRGPNPFPHASFAGGTPMAARYAQKRPSSRWPVEVSTDVVSVTRGLGVVWPHKARRREKRAHGHDHTHHESSHRLGALLWSFLPLEAASPKGLTTGGVLTQLLEEWSQRVQFRAKAGPVTGFQLLHSAVVVAQRLPRPIGLGAGERGFGWRPRRGG
jgi:hypothetical protein